MLEYLHVADDLPVLQNRVYPDIETALRSPTGNVALQASPQTGIVSNVRFDPSRVTYDSHYHNEQALSKSFQAHLQRVSEVVCRHLDCGSLVEIGCGKGAFLEVLAARGIDATGFDPAFEGSNPRIRRELFSRESRMRGSGVVLRHVLEHIPDPVGFLRLIRDANQGMGAIYIEVPCLDWILANRAWFDIFYEHVNYFRISDFHRMFGNVLHAEHCFGGQYLSIVADLDSLRDPGPAEPPAWPMEFFRSLDRTMNATPPGTAEVTWGAASKGVIFGLFRQRRGRPLAGAVDINPAKQGQHLPCTGLRVFDPRSAIERFPRGTIAWVMNSNYLAEIQAMAGTHFDVRPLESLGVS